MTHVRDRRACVLNVALAEAGAVRSLKVVPAFAGTTEEADGSDGGVRGNYGARMFTLADGLAVRLRHCFACVPLLI